MVTPRCNNTFYNRAIKGCFQTALAALAAGVQAGAKAGGVLWIHS